MTNLGRSVSDRTVHAVTAYGTEVVRYDRAGKWYFERDRDGQKVQCSLAEAVKVASRPDVRFLHGRPGGRRFDALVRAARREQVA